MQKYLAQRYRNVTLPALSKAEQMVSRYDDAIDLSAGDPDYPADRTVIDQMYCDALGGHTRYTESLGDEELRHEICNWYRHDYGCEYGVENIMITSGGTHAMYLLLESILDKGDEVVVISPYYTYYAPQILMTGGRMVVFETSPRDNFELDIERLETVLSPRTKAVIVNSPNNPTGRVYAINTLTRLIYLADKHDFLIIADDVYTNINFTDRTSPICSLDSRNKRIVTVSSFSKNFAMTGFRLGYIFGEQRLIECVRNVNEAVHFTVCSLSQRAGIYAVRRRKEIRQGLCDEYEKRVFYAYERIRSLKNMQCALPEGTFYLFVNIADTGLTSEEVWEKMLEDAHVLVTPGNCFGDAGEGYIRIACTTGVERLQEAFDRIEGIEIFS